MRPAASTKRAAAAGGVSSRAASAKSASRLPTGGDGLVAYVFTGETAKAVGQAARAELEEFLGRRVHLFLEVKVRPGWLEEQERYRQIGLDWTE